MNDCGVFTVRQLYLTYELSRLIFLRVLQCMFMESLSRDHPGFDFQQKNMT